MFQSNELDYHLKTSDTIKTGSKIFAEWNLNDLDNIKRLGNYRYRPSFSASPYYLIPSTYIENEIGPTYFYTGATDSDIAIESGLNDEDQPTMFVSEQQKMKMLFSLEDCVKPFRPRSGINKLLYLGSIGSTVSKTQFIDDAKSSAARRPRYYMASRDDQFKYWTSFRKEFGIPTPKTGEEIPTEESQTIRGVSFYDSATQRYYIEDAAPFVVYKESVPANKIVVKMQTNVGEVSLGNFRYGEESGVSDPLYGDENKTTPVRWKIEALKNNNWTTLVEFDENSVKSDGSPLIGSDGYVEISYGFKIPERYQSLFVFAEELSNSSLLPTTAVEGYTYLVKENENSRGTMFIYINGEWEEFTPEYSWHLSSEQIDKNSNLIKKLADPTYYIENNEKVYTEFDFIDGMRIVVQTMNKENCSFDLIEFSPRLMADITDSVSNFSITKTLSDLGNSSIPIGSLLASQGSMEIFDTDFAFSENNSFNNDTSKGSIVSKYLDNNVKILFYQSVYDVEGYDYSLPIKTMYATSFPQTTSPASVLNLQMRDFFFFLESSQAPQLFLTDVSLSYVVMTLLDYIGFDNYVFNRIDGYPELIIPYFFVEPGQNVAEVLQKLAVASQTSMFFDEYNNFVVMSKEYLLPESEEERQTDSILVGQETVFDTDGNDYYLNGFVYSEDELPSNYEYGIFVNIDNDGIYEWSENSATWENIATIDKIYYPNIESIASQDKKVYNSGQINYTSRYLQRSVGSVSAALKLDEYKNYIYKPVLLWEVQGNENRQTINEIGGQSSGYVLGAVPLNTDLSSDQPYALNNIIYNNIIDVGENVYWMTNYQGYFYANGEIIKYDAIEYVVSGLSSPVWITNNQQYQDYFSSMTFNGKMYPTGRVRIYTDPQFESYNGEIRLKDANPIIKNGRGQFGTEIVSHRAGLNTDEYWTNNDYVRGCIQEASSYLFNTSQYITYPSNLTNSDAGKTKTISETYIDANSLSEKTGRTGIIKNFMTDKYFTETEIKYKKTTEPGTVQSSALVMVGPEIPSVLSSQNFVSYVYKDFFDQNGASIPYKHYGTRMRIVGKIESGTSKSQTAIGGFPIYTGGVTEGNITSSSADASNNSDETIISGGSGGIGINVDKQKNTGYYFEIVALTANNINNYISDNTPNVVSANILATPAPTCTNGTVTVYTQTQISFEVGQQVIVTGLVDSNDPTNTLTPLNGEYTITAINENKKSFQYNIGTTLTTTSDTGGVALANVSDQTNIANIFFYKIVSDADGNAIPYKLWSGLSKINVDSGQFYGQSRLLNEDESTVYDLAAEYINVGSSRRFFLYLNNKQVAVVDDDAPLDEKNSVALFVRGTSKCMFENVYAMSTNYSQNSVAHVQNGVSKVFDDYDIDSTEALRKYAINGIIQQTYLSGISSMEEPKYKMYFEEFGTILREAAYFNILYDRAYPALYAKLMKPMNDLKGYTTSGFYAWSYGAEFLIFNATDFALILDDTSGNYLRIIGAAFTQSTSYTLTVDDLYKKRSNLLDTQPSQNLIYDQLTVEEEYNKIKNSRNKYGKNEITIESPYIQSSDAAENVFGWTIKKVSTPRKMIGVNTFGTENMQLGDIIKLSYVNYDGLSPVAPKDSRFVIYQIEYNRKEDGISSTMYLAEV